MLIQGKAFYFKALGKPHPKYEPKEGNEWTFELSLDKAALELCKKLGIEDKVKNKGGERGSFLKFSRGEFKGDKETANSPIRIVDHKGNPWDQKVLIGNGSTLNVKFNTYPGRKGNKPVVLSVQVWDHVPYKPDETLKPDKEFPVRADEEWAPDSVGELA